MINHEHKFIFIHIPKNAGTSIGKALNRQCGISELYESYRIHSDKFDEKIWEEYFVFSFVRNPFARMWSQYIYRNWLYQKYPFNEILVDNLERIFDIEMEQKESDRYYYGPGASRKNKIKDRENIIAFFSEKIHCATQTDFLKGMYSDGVDKRPYIDYVGRVETLQTDFDFICDKIGIDKIKLPRENPSIGGAVHTSIDNYLDAYDENTIKSVAKKCSDDIKNYKYYFEGFDE